MNIVNCIYCGSDQDLKNELTVTIDDADAPGGKTKVVLKVCDAHAEEATIKSAREAYVRRKDEIKQFLEMGKALGIDLTGAIQHKSGLIAAQTPARPEQQAQAAPRPVQVFDEDMVDSKIVDRAAEKGMITPSKSLGDGLGMVETGTSRTPIDSLPIPEEKKAEIKKAIVGKVKLEPQIGKGGMPIVLPTKRVDGLGTTTVRIVESSDAHLQRRFKNLGHDSMNDRTTVNFKENYDVKECNLCQGKTTVKNRGQDQACPKCKGTGWVD
jgi:hypothetical protein